MPAFYTFRFRTMTGALENHCRRSFHNSLIHPSIQVAHKLQMLYTEEIGITHAPEALLDNLTTADPFLRFVKVIKALKVYS